MKKRIFLVVFWLISLFFGCFSLAIGSMDSLCSAKAFDASGLSVLKGEGYELLGEINNSGADLRVFLLKNLPENQKSPNDYFTNLLEECPKLQNSKGEIKDDLIFLLICLKERQSVLFWGEKWSETLPNNWTNIQQNLMHPEFKKGNYQEGIAIALKEIKKLIQKSHEIPPSSGFSSSPAVSRTKPAPVVSQKEITSPKVLEKKEEGTSKLQIFFYLVILAIAVLLIFKSKKYFIIFFGREKRRERRRAIFKAKNLEKNLFEAGEEIQKLEPLVISSQVFFDEETSQETQAKFEWFKKEKERIDLDSVRVRLNFGNPRLYTFSTKQYVKIGEELDKVDFEAESLLNQIDILSKKIKSAFKADWEKQDEKI